MHPLVEVRGRDVPQLKQGQQDTEGGIPVACQHGFFMFGTAQIKLVIVVPDESHTVVKHAEQMDDPLVVIGKLAHQIVD